MDAPQRHLSNVDARRTRLGSALRELAADLVAERRRRMELEREVRLLRARLEGLEPGTRETTG
jgi:hypothetical protein